MKQTRRGFLKFFGKAGLVVGAITKFPSLAKTESKPENNPDFQKKVTEPKRKVMDIPRCPFSGKIKIRRGGPFGPYHYCPERPPDFPDSLTCITRWRDYAGRKKSDFIPNATRICPLSGMKMIAVKGPYGPYNEPPI